VKKKDRWTNSILIVITIAGVGAWLIVWPFHEYLSRTTEQIRLGKDWLAVVAGAAYMVGYFVSRIVEDAFDAVFSKPPFSETGADMPDGKMRHPVWVDYLLMPVGYLLFVARVALTVFCLMLAVRLVVWIVQLF